MRYVAVRSLERYQHYKDRNPPWVKLHRKILGDEDFADLTVSARLVFVLSLLLASERENCIPADPSWLAVELNMPRNLVAKSLAELLAHEYLIPASKVASNGANGLVPNLPPPENREQRTERTTTKPNTKQRDVA